MVRVELDLSRHCIQAEIKSRYKHLLSQCLSASEEDLQAEKKLEALKTALETLDFPRLRALYPELNGHNKEKVALTIDLKGQIVIEINKKSIDTMVSH